VQKIMVKAFFRYRYRYICICFALIQPKYMQSFAALLLIKPKMKTYLKYSYMYVNIILYDALVVVVVIIYALSD